MPVVADFTEVVGNRPTRIGDRRSGGERVWEGDFNTGGRWARGPVFMIFEVQGLTQNELGAVVSVNGRDVGRIHPYEGDRQAVYTQMISFPASLLKSQGNNVVQIEAIEREGASSNDLFDDFDISNMCVFFHQEA
jgi:hypothetical protein